jgi:transposase, IS5 family
LLETNNLASQILATINAKLIEWNLLLKACTVVQMDQNKRGNQWHFGIKAHIVADAKSCLIHSVTGTATNEHDITQAHALLRGEENIYSQTSATAASPSAKRFKRSTPRLTGKLP